MATAPVAPAEEASAGPRVIQMDEEALLRLLAEARSGGSYLPPEAYRGEDGVVYRDVREPTGRYRSVRDENGKEVRREEIVRWRKRLVRLVTDPSPTGLIECAKYCKRHASNQGPDFYHPRYGWIRNGCKREKDVDENLGTGAQAFRMEYIPIQTEDDYGEGTATIAGVDEATLADGDSADDGPPPGDAADDPRLVAGRKKGS